MSGPAARKAFKRTTGGWVGIASEYRAFRYGSKPVTLAPILTGRQRAAIAEKVATTLDCWTYSPFQHEAACRAHLRVGLVLDGNGWHDSDAEAVKIVGEALRMNGAERPSWAEGQKYHTIARENCLHCRAELDAHDIVRGRRFCSLECTRAARLEEDEAILSRDHPLYSAFWHAMHQAKAAPRRCEACGRVFRTAREDQRHCSLRCAGVSHRTVAERECPHCKKLFRPPHNGIKYCSKACADERNKGQYLERLPERACPICSTIFRPLVAHAVYCCKACKTVVKNAARRKDAVPSRLTCDPVSPES